MPQPNPEHVDRWVRQFDPAVQEPMLGEMDHVLKQSYLSRRLFLDFLTSLAQRSSLTGGSGLWPTLCAVVGRWLRWVRRGHGYGVFPGHWRRVGLLDIQKHGASQQEMLQLLTALLGRAAGIGLGRSGSAPGLYLYLDDALFTGHRILADIVPWICNESPRRADLVIAVVVYYRHGFWYTHKKLIDAIRATGKVIRVHWLRGIEYEDRRWAGSAADRLYPASIPDVPLAHAYAQTMYESVYPPRLRVPTGSNASRLFSSEAGRHLLEQQFLLAGLKIRSFYWNPQAIMRPLGYDVRNGFGFGATVTTYRNCPNNCPLAWWWDTAAIPATRTPGKWYPLFPRKV